MTRSTDILSIDGFLSYFEAAFPRGNLEKSTAWWLGPGMIEMRRWHGTVLIGGIWIAPNRRGRGAGSRMLKFVCQQADAYRVKLTLRARPFDQASGGLKAVELKHWYGRAGFLPDPDRPGYLTRSPHDLWVN